MTTATCIESARQMLAVEGFTSKQQARRIEKLASVLEDCPNAVLVRTCDEKTGERYGKRQARAGRRAVKIGYTTYRYQLWAVCA